MPKKYLQLEDTRVYYDQETGAIRLISKDPRLKGSPFQLNLLRDSDSTESIYRLLEAEDLLGDRLNVLPDLAYLPPSELRQKRASEQPEENSRAVGNRDLRFLVGETYEKHLLEIDLHRTPHTLISGGTGTGKSTLLRSLMEQVVEDPELMLCHIDVRHREEATSTYERFRLQDRRSTDLESAMELIWSLGRELKKRQAQLELEGKNSWMDLPNTNAIILAVEEYSDLLFVSGSSTREIDDLFGQIARLGRAAGIYLLLCTSRPDATILPGEFKANLGRRILLGNADSVRQSITLGSPISYATSTQKPLGRGVLRVYNSPIRNFQGFAQR